MTNSKAINTEERCCTRCKQTLPIHAFGRDKSRKGGINPRCKPCNRLHIKGFSSAVYVTPEHDPSVAAPRQINIMQGTYVPDREAYCRNDGLKHIKSLGF